MGALKSCCTQRKTLNQQYTTLKFNDTPSADYTELLLHTSPGEQQLISEYVNHYEQTSKMDFSLVNIKKIIDESEVDLEDFEHIKSSDFMNVYLRLGSKYDKKCPFSKVFYTFDGGKYSADQILFILSNVDLRTEWDTNICQSSLIEKVSDVMSVIHVGVKAPFPYSNRDFVQKRIHFKNQGAFYSYFTSTKDSVRPVQYHNGRELYVRGEMIIGYQVLRKVDGNWRLFIAAQTNLKVSGYLIQMKSVPHKLVKVIFPKTQENWYKRFIATVEKYKKSQLSTSAPPSKTQKLILV